MEEINNLLLLSGQDIPFRTARVSIHQPKIREIAYIGEENFHIGVRFLLFNKDDLGNVDKSDLSNYDNFDIFMSIMNSKESAKHKADAIMVLTLMFPDIKFKIDKDKILLQLENFESSINKLNFADFQDIIRQIFCLSSMDEADQYNPADGLAKKIADKFKKAHQKLAKQHGEDIKNINIMGRYVSILSVGLQKDMNQLMDYTLYQLMDEFKRYQNKTNYDLTIQAKMAGATGLEEVDNWME